ncbi:hypothetical protein LCGC14_2925890 [marine sediment metagenome]|uniref:Uncharacterized protein n=1 Tax=marine sediment metagenome TaxID=412755 RepID=A0A0F8Y964_9ZZZZ
MKKHKGYSASCDRCGAKYCPDCNGSSCPSCCLHEDCIVVKERDAALEALEEARGALQEYGTHGSGCLAKGWKRGDNEYRCGLDAAIDMTPAEAEKEGR